MPAYVYHFNRASRKETYLSTSINRSIIFRISYNLALA